MDATAVAPNVVSFNSTIGACETGLGCNPWLMSSLIPRFHWRSHHVGNQRIQPSRDDFAPFAGQWKMEQSLRDDLQVSQWCQAVQREDPDQNGWVQKWPKCMGIRVFPLNFQTNRMLVFSDLDHEITDSWISNVEGLHLSDSAMYSSIFGMILSKHRSCF